MTCIVLLVEDNEDTRFIVGEFCMEQQIPYRAVTDYAQLQHLMQHDPTFTATVVLIDLRLPDADGYQVLTYLRAQPSLHQAAMLAFTAHVFPADRDRLQAAGFDGFMAKPIEEQRFLQTIQRALAGERVWDSHPTPPPMQQRVAATLQPQRTAYITKVQHDVPALKTTWHQVPSDPDPATLHQLRVAVHTLAGSAAQLGFHPFSVLLRSLEHQIVQILEHPAPHDTNMLAVIQILDQLDTMVAALPHTPVQWSE